MTAGVQIDWMLKCLEMPTHQIIGGRNRLRKVDFGGRNNAIDVNYRRYTSPLVSFCAGRQTVKMSCCQVQNLQPALGQIAIDADT